MRDEADPNRIVSVEELRSLVGRPHRLTQHKFHPCLDDESRRFIAASPLFLMATSDREGRPMVTPKGDPPGFVRVLDDRSLAIPERRGNKLVLGLQALLENPSVALIFLVPGTSVTLRVEGSATLTREPELLATLHARGKPPLLAIKVAIERRYFHCSKAFNRSQLWNPEMWPPEIRVSAGGQVAAQLADDADAIADIDARTAIDDTTNL